MDKTNMCLEGSLLACSDSHVTTVSVQELPHVAITVSVTLGWYAMQVCMQHTRVQLCG